MVALCAHMLAERGKLDLDAPVARYWPEFAQAGKQEIPVRWLLSHRAGLPAIRRMLPAEALFDWSAMTAALAESSPWWTPGSRHGYHAITFGHLVGEVIRRVDGRSVGAFLRDEVTGPLRADFFIGVPAEVDARAAVVLPPPPPGRAHDLGHDPGRSRLGLRPHVPQSARAPRTWSTRAPGARPRSRPPTATPARAGSRASTPRSRAAASSTRSACSRPPPSTAPSSSSRRAATRC